MKTSDVSTPELAGFAHRYLPGGPGPCRGTVLLLLHGTGGDENSLLGLGRDLAPGAALLSPRGQVIEGSSTRRFFRRLAEGVFDEDDLRRRSAGLAEFVRATAGHYGFEPGSVRALGFSNGANIAAATLLLHPGALGGAMLLRAMTPLESGEPQRTAAVPILLCSGLRDPLVPVDDARHLAEMLRGGGASVTHHWENSGHELSAGDFAAMRDWLSGPGRA